MPARHARPRREQQADPTARQEPVTLESIADRLERLRWRHCLWGVDEREAWHVIGRLDEMYRQLLREQEVRYETLLAEARGAGAGGEGR